MIVWYLEFGTLPLPYLQPSPHLKITLDLASLVEPRFTLNHFAPLSLGSRAPPLPLPGPGRFRKQFRSRIPTPPSPCDSECGTAPPCPAPIVFEILSHSRFCPTLDPVGVTAGPSIRAHSNCFAFQNFVFQKSCLFEMFLRFRPFALLIMLWVSAVNLFSRPQLRAFAIQPSHHERFLTQK